MGTGFFSLRESMTQTSFGQSAPLSCTHSSLTIQRSLSNNGSKVWMKPLKGGEWFQCDTTLMSALLEMSNTKAPPSM